MGHSNTWEPKGLVVYVHENSQIDKIVRGLKAQQHLNQLSCEFPFNSATQPTMFMNFPHVFHEMDGYSSATSPAAAPPPNGGTPPPLPLM